MSQLDFFGEIPRNSEDSIKVFHGQYWKIEVIDFRWYKNDKPTKKGIRINKEEATVLYRMLGQILEEEE
tara:strand:- start:8664 stop:8870 length:207 start_codon:yes stop_codon:yes gene_type:complete